MSHHLLRKQIQYLAKGVSINNVTYVVITQELEYIINLHVPSVLIWNRYYHPTCGGFLCIDLSSEYILVL